MKVPVFEDVKDETEEEKVEEEEKQEDKVSEKEFDYEQNVVLYQTRRKKRFFSLSFIFHRCFLSLLLKT